MLVVGSDPGANCSTGEFDCRLLSLHTHIPILEPGDFQDASDMTLRAFTLSEELHLPVMVVIPSKMCYGMGTVKTNALRPDSAELQFTHRRELTNIGGFAVDRHRLLMAKIDRLKKGDPALASIVPKARNNILPSKTLVVTSGIYRNT